MALISSHMMRQRLEALRYQYVERRRIAHVQALDACLVQLEEVEAFAEEQDAALLHDREQLRTLANYSTPSKS